MKKKTTFLQSAITAALACTFATGVTNTFAESDKQTGPQPMECVDIVAEAMLGPDSACITANSHHRMEEYPEAVFYCDDEEVDCSDLMNPCAVKGKIVGTIGGHDFIARTACGFTLNDLGEEAAEHLATLGYQQFTARTNLGVFLGTTEIPEASPGTDEVKPDFGLFLGDSGVSRSDFYVSQRMNLTGARKLPEGTKGLMDMTGLPPVRTVTGSLCGPNLTAMLDRIANEGKKESHDEDDD